MLLKALMGVGGYVVIGASAAAAASTWREKRYGWFGFFIAIFVAGVHLAS